MSSIHAPDEDFAKIAYNPEGTPLIELQNICKTYGSVRANHNISLKLHAGRIKALLGENGAGKSTLMSMLAGQSNPDSGRILVRGTPQQLASPKDALAAGIGMVYQHFMLVESLSVADNVLLGQKGSYLLRPAVRRLEVEALSARYGLFVDPEAKVSNLSMGEKQRVEILKLLCRESRVLILDEPTAVLTPNETEHLFISLSRMAKEGRSIVFISHKLHEVLALADEIAILRKGQIVDEFDISHVPDENELAKRMLGRDLSHSMEKSLAGLQDASIMGSPTEIGLDSKKSDKSAVVGKVHKSNAQLGHQSVLELQDLSGHDIKNVSFNLHKGEVLALLGVAGNGQKELVEILTGLAQPESGDLRILGNDWRKFYHSSSRKKFRKHGLGYIPEDRRGLASCPQMSLIDNFLLTTRGLFSSSVMGFILKRKNAISATKELIKNYKVEPGIAEASAKSLSGGNLQKLIIGRELYRSPRCIIAENPTQGLDIAATQDVWQRLEKAKANAGILLVTGDLTEALNLADTVAVMFRGRLLAIFPRSDQKSVASIGLLMAGLEGEHGEA